MQKHKKLEILSNELFQFLYKIQGMYLDSIVGYKLLNDNIQVGQEKIKEFLKSTPGEQDASEIETEGFQDKITFAHKNLYGKDFAASAIHFVNKGEVKKRNKEGGENHKNIANTCVVMLYAYWEHCFRKELADAYGYSKTDDIKNDFWEDMRELRHSILHNKEKCSRKLAKAKVLRWYKEGQTIELLHDKMREIFLNVLIFKNKVYSDSLERLTFRIPKVDKKV